MVLLIVQTFEHNHGFFSMFCYGPHTIGKGRIKTHMQSETLIGQMVINSKGKHIRITDIENQEDIKHLIIKLKNHKMYYLLPSFKSGNIKFIDKNINKYLYQYLYRLDKRGIPLTI